MSAIWCACSASQSATPPILLADWHSLKTMVSARYSPTARAQPDWSLRLVLRRTVAKVLSIADWWRLRMCFHVLGLGSREGEQHVAVLWPGRPPLCQYLARHNSPLTKSSLDEVGMV